MRAIIFNSGLGSRLGELTANRPKCLVELPDTGETILHRQLRVLHACGLRDFVVTTGPYAELVRGACAPFERRGCRFAFVDNPQYRTTNYIHSLWLARDLVVDDMCEDVLMLHGDLVFDEAYVRDLLAAPAGSYGSVDHTQPVPKKDFSASVTDGLVRKVGVGIEGEGLVAFQALYRLTANALRVWLDEVAAFERRGCTDVYAENAANEVFDAMEVRAYSFAGHLVAEVDTPEDLANVSAEARLCDLESQRVVQMSTQAKKTAGCSSHASAATPEAAWAAGLMYEVATELARLGAQRPLVVADRYFAQGLGLSLAKVGDASGALFSDFAPNPTWEQVLSAFRAFEAAGCDAVVSLGGGSAIDVAKCVKLLAAVPRGHERDVAEGRVVRSEVPHVAIPTTAGTGSESTHFAVVYVNGTKHSVAHVSALPDVAILEPSLLRGLPAYQRASTMLDALCHAIESHWSARSSERSRAHSSRALVALRDCAIGYVEGDEQASHVAMRAANEAGKAINLSTTTAAHAMSYGLSSLLGIAHGHAASLCLPGCWRLLLQRADDTTRAYLAEIDALLCGQDDVEHGAGLVEFERLRALAGLKPVRTPTDEELEALVRKVEPLRLANFPLRLSEDDIRALYRQAF